MDARKSAVFAFQFCKTSVTDHHTPNIMHGFRDTVLFRKMRDCSIRKNFEHFHSFPLLLLLLLIYLKLTIKKFTSSKFITIVIKLINVN